jgi:uncharacterized membrane protein YhaH (DUF805 family)
MQWTLALKRYFQFSGRSGRAEYWQFIGFLIASVVVASALESSTDAYQRSGVPTLTFLVLLGLIVPMYAVTFRRLHDRNHSGWLVGGLLGLNALWFMVEHIRSIVRGSVADVPFKLFNGADLIATVGLSFYLLYQVFLRGDEGTNRFGPPLTGAAPDIHPAAETARSLVASARGLFPDGRGVDPISQLERLAKLHQDGVLTDAEFAHQKTALLQRAAS